MTAPSDHIDKPEPRWQAILALLAIGGIYLALPRNLVIGPVWLVPAVIVVLLVPTVVSHRLGGQSLNRTLGIIISGITTLALIGSVILLVRALPTHREPPRSCCASGGLLWLTNVMVFALWYWRLDGGGPSLRQNKRNSAAQVFSFHRCRSRKMSVDQFECVRWRPHFIDYLFVAFTQSSTFGPTDAPLLARWAKVLAMIQIFNLPPYCCPADLTVRWAFCRASLRRTIWSLKYPNRLLVFRSLFGSFILFVEETA